MEFSVPVNSCSKEETSAPEEIQSCLWGLQQFCKAGATSAASPTLPLHSPSMENPGSGQQLQQPAHTWRGIQSSWLLLCLQHNLCQGRASQNEEMHWCSVQRKAACSR